MHLLVAFVLGLLALARASTGPPVEVLTPLRSLPSQIASRLDRPRACVETTTGDLLVLDGGAHAVFLVDARRTGMRRLLSAGSEWGHILRPSALAIGSDDVFAVADTPTRYDRIQYFSTDGALLGRFYPPGAPQGTRLTIGPLVMNGIGAMQFTGRTFLFTAPNTDALMMEVATDGQPIRSIGALRSTGHESDRSLHLALNAGLPLIDPTGGFIFVFQTGLPMFRKYDASGALLYERHIEGAELDATLRTMPTTWRSRSEGDGTLPYAPPSVSAAAVDSQGRLWVSLTAPFTYVYDTAGDKIRVIQFKDDTGIVMPAALSFTRGNRLLVSPGCEEFSGN